MRRTRTPAGRDAAPEEAAGVPGVGGGHRGAHDALAAADGLHEPHEQELPVLGAGNIHKMNIFH